ncbi:MAG: endolytic transglycosylase MltG [Hyphomicrobiaceae bacterium]
MLKLLNGLLTGTLMVLITAGALFAFVKHQFDKPGPLDYATTIVIPKGDGVNSIAGRLVKEGVLRDRWLFKLGVMRFRAQKKLKAGEYAIAKHASVREVLDTLTEGRAILHRVTVPEGRTSYEAVQILNAAPLLTGEITEIPPEGSLLPDTYSFSRGTDRNELLAQMKSDRKKFLSQAWSKRDKNLPYKTMDEALVMASIVEKETGRADERDHIAGVFVNRLRKGMRLQSDPTIIYGITQGRGKLGRGLRRSEIDRKTQYNTYQIDGLPPGPICNPGRSALTATLAPAETKDLFFVADGTGGHVFAPTLREHENNVRKWRKIEKELRAKQKAAEDAAGESANSGG